MFFLSCVCYVFVRVCLYVPCGHLLGTGEPLGSRLLCLTVSLSLSHWYPGSGVVLDCIDSVCSLQPCDHLHGKGYPLGSFVVAFSCAFVTFPYGVQGQVLYLIVSILVLYLLLYFKRNKWNCKPAK